jgi:hypothetical protein
MIGLELRNLDQLGLTFVCGTCHHKLSVTLVPNTDGIELFVSGKDFHFLRLLPPSVVSVQTAKGNLSISFGVCRSGKSAVIISREPAGICSLPENSEKETINHEWKRKGNIAE